MLITNISKLIPITSAPIFDATIEIDDGKIKWFGLRTSFRRKPESSEVFDCKGGVVTPGLVDCHTHLVHAGTREKEYAMRAEGKSYLDIAKAGGGILSTVAATREASFEELYDLSAKRLKEAIAFGSTTIEIKSGYGLNTETELKILKVIQKLQKNFPVTLVPTFMGAHTLPPEFKKNREGYLRLVMEEMLPEIAKLGIVRFCDVFVEEEAFTKEEATQIVKASAKYKIRCKLHVDQLTAGSGAELAAQLNAVSADHLEQISADGIAALKKSGTIPVVLPGASFFVGVRPAPARKLLDAGLPVAIATDYNPGTNPNLNLMLAATQAVSLCKMTVEEAWRGITIHAAKALGLEKEKGSLDIGKDADLIVWNAPDEIYPLYRYGSHCVQHVFAKGQILPLCKGELEGVDR